MFDENVYEHNKTIIVVKNAAAQFTNGLYRFDEIDYNENFSPIFKHVDTNDVYLKYNATWKRWEIKKCFRTVYHCESAHNANSIHELPPKTGWEVGYKKEWKNKSVPVLEMIRVFTKIRNWTFAFSVNY